MATYSPIASRILPSAAASVTFSNIPQTYTDLIVIISAIKSGANSSSIAWQANGDTGGNYSATSMYGVSGGTGSDRGSNANYSAVGRVGTSQSTSILNFQNYSNTTTHKTCIARGDTLGGQDIAIANVGLWRNTAAITSLVFTLNDSSNFNSGATFNLYGIDASLSNQAKATGGTTIIRDSSYWYHVFTTSGTFTPTQNITADYLVVAGGGGGGHAGGGGAGGLRAIASQSLTTQAYTVTVGAGGTRYQYNPKLLATSGGNSVFNGLTSTGGGRGSTGDYPASNGGSGGGGNSTAYGLGYTTAGTSSPTTSPAQGNSGGGGGGGLGGGGGGGAGGAGSGQSGDTGGAGGAGANSYNSITITSWLTATSTGVSGYLAGGGGGGGNGAGAGGSGGGGAGATGDNSATSGTANTGSGGGGSRVSSGSLNTAFTGAGGSGIVIIRYAV